MRSVILALSTFLPFALSASAQVSKQLNIYGGGGTSLASSPSWFRDLWKDGFHVSGGFGFKAAPMLQILARVQYHSFPYDYDKPEAKGMIGFSQNLYMLGVDGRFTIGVPGARASIFVFGGIGAAKLTATESRVGWKRVALPLEETRMYTNVGGGIEFGAASILTFFVQGSYVSIPTSRETLAFVPITVGFKF